MPRKVTQLQVGAKTDTGRKRDHNEDQFALVEQYKEKVHWPLAEKKGNLYVVADGMGGHNAGEVASRLAVEIIAQEYYRDDSSDVETSLRQAIEEANRQVYARAQQVRTEAGMGSTIVAAVIRGDEIFVAHAGDSRAYRVRQGHIEPLTEDHSWVSEQLARNLITPEQARTHPYRNYITRSLGIKSDLEVDTNHWAVQQGDVYLLCSDGLSGQLQDEEMGSVISQREPLDASEELVRRANEAGGPDNITAVVMRVERVVPTLAAYRAGVPAPVPSTDQVPARRKTTELLPATETMAAERFLADETRRTMPMFAGVAFAILTILALAAAAFFYLRNLDLEQSNQELEARLQAAETTLAVLPSEAATGTEAAQPTRPGPAPKDTSAPTSQPTNTPTATFSASPTNTPLPTPTQTPTRTLASTEAPTDVPPLPIPATVGNTGGQRLNLRKAPRETAAFIRFLTEGTALLVWGRNPDGDWLNVTTLESSPGGEIRGWVSAQYVDIDVLIDVLPVVPPTFEPSATPTSTGSPTLTPAVTSSPETTGEPESTVEG